MHLQRIFRIALHLSTSPLDFHTKKKTQQQQIALVVHSWLILVAVLFIDDVVEIPLCRNSIDSRSHFIDWTSHSRCFLAIDFGRRCIFDAESWLIHQRRR